jgi:hypothetical protein
LVREQTHEEHGFPDARIAQRNGCFRLDHREALDLRHGIQHRGNRGQSEPVGVILDDSEDRAFVCQARYDRDIFPERCSIDFEPRIETVR